MERKFPPQHAEINRRLIGASALSASAPNVFAEQSQPGGSNATGALRKGMMGFMLPHEQFLGCGVGGSAAEGEKRGEGG